MKKFLALVLFAAGVGAPLAASAGPFWTALLGCDANGNVREVQVCQDLLADDPCLDFGDFFPGGSIKGQKIACAAAISTVVLAQIELCEHVPTALIHKFISPPSATQGPQGLFWTWTAVCVADG